MKGHVRTIKIALEAKLGKEIPEDHGLLSWIVQFASQSYNRFHLGADGRSPKERLIGRRVPRPACHFGENVYWMPLAPDGKPPSLDPRFLEGYFGGYCNDTDSITGPLCIEVAVPLRRVPTRDASALFVLKMFHSV